MYESKLAALTTITNSDLSLNVCNRHLFSREARILYSKVKMDATKDQHQELEVDQKCNLK
jgi:hypothetical protein